MTEQPTAHEDPFPESDPDSGQLALSDPRDSGTLEVFPPTRGKMTEARQMLSDHVAMLDDAYRVADIVCQTPAAPARYRGKAKEGTVAIMYGAELGLPPMAALQKVINIHGMPSIEARTMKGLLKAKGFQFRTIVKAEDEFIIHAWEPGSDKRTDPPDEIAHWTMARARQAEYAPRPDPDNPGEWIKRRKQDGTEVVDGNMKYVTDPVGMLEAKGTADVCRAIAPEILMGLPYCTEERDDWVPDDEDDEEPERPRRRGRAKGVNALRDRAKAAGAKAEERAEAAVDEPQDAEVVEPETEAEAASADTRDQAVATASMERFLGYAPGTPPSDSVARVTSAQQQETVPASDDTQSTAENIPAAAAAQPADTGSGAPSAEVPEAPAATSPPAAAPDPAPTDSGAAAPASAEPAAAPEHPTVTREEGVTGEDLPGTAAAPPPAPTPAADGMEMSEEVRARGERMLGNLLAEAKVEAEDDCCDVVSEILAKQPSAKYRHITALYEVTNRELKEVVDVLRAHQKKGDLYTYCGEALNAASLRAAGMMEA